MVNASDNGADEVGAESALVQRRADQVGESLGRDVALLAKSVHVDLEAEEI